MTDEAAMLFRISIFGVIAAVIYGVITQEWLGTAGLLALGLGPGFAGWAMLVLSRKEHPPEPLSAKAWRFVGLPRPASQGTEQAPALEEEDIAVIPSPSIWPMAISLGIAISLSGLIFGLWIVLVGASLALWSVWGWLAALGRETLAAQQGRQ